MAKLDMATLRDRIYACWIGKNIGGTMGAPYECKQDLNDIHGFASKPGEPLPNDDLDLQLVWLRAVDELGPEAIDSKVLGEYWLSYIMPHWNEYGVGKANMRAGIMPPMSGEYDNEEWKNSNGAWIRTEIWACLYPARVERAIRMAFEDASVDHGFGEGTYAAIFVATLQSAAFVIRDARALLKIGLSKIPSSCRVARSVRLVIDAYDRGQDWKATRQALVEDSADLGWFQAPANIGFTVLGLLYGEGDFKKSLIYAINCGDDTDCTGATLGALLGIMGGTAAIPEDWRAYIGDEIKTICVLNGHGRFPASCTELTDCVMNLLPTTLRQGNVALMEGENADPDFTEETLMGTQFVDSFQNRKPYSVTAENVMVQALVEMEDKPVIAPNQAISGTVSLVQHLMPEQRHCTLRFLLPEGWSVECKRDVFVPGKNSRYREQARAVFTLTAGEHVDALNRVVLEIISAGRAMPLYVPIVVMG